MEINPWLIYCIRIFFCSTPWGVIYVLYIITNVFAHFALKIIPRIIAVTTLFSGICPLYYQYCNWENPYKYTTAVYPVCQLLFFDVFVLILSLIFLVKLFDIATFLMLMHTYSLFSFSKQIRASLSDENSG